MRIKILIVIGLLSMAFSANADLVKSKFNRLTVNANLINAEDKSKPFFLILHGTWAWYGMELIAATQEFLEEEESGSLAITLSLGIDDRTGFLGCPSEISAIHQQAYQELDHWYQYLSNLGYNNIILLSHSRGGSQAAGFVNAYPDDKLNRLVLLAPMAWEKQNVHQQYKKKSKLDLQQLIDRAETLQHQISPSLMQSVDVLYCQKQNVTAASFLSYYSDKIERNTWDLIKNLTIPVDIFLGSEDPISTHFKASVANKKLPSNIKMHTIQGADHFFRDLYLEEVLEPLLEVD